MFTLPVTKHIAIYQAPASMLSTLGDFYMLYGKHIFYIYKNLLKLGMFNSLLAEPTLVTNLDWAMKNMTLLISFIYLLLA